jgi:hypothetical protein
MLINTSGAGKTRLLLDGLCHFWGIYLVGSNERDSIGSTDLQTFLRELDQADGYRQANEARKANEDDQLTFDIMKGIKRCLFQIILARFLLLNLLIEEAKKSGGVRRKEHRRLWTLLQVQPRKFDPSLEEDVFLTIARELQSTSTKDLDCWISELYTKISRELGDVEDPGDDHRVTIYCILDEVHKLKFPHVGGYGLKDNNVERPVLREVWVACSSVHPEMRIIFSGTEFDIGQIMATFESPALAEKRPILYSNIGSFDDIGFQAEYIQYYLLAPWSEPRWKEFLVRAFQWLRGR